MFAFLRLGRDEALLCEGLQRLTDGGAADAEAFREEGFLDLRADLKRALADKGTDIACDLIGVGMSLWVWALRPSS